MERKNGGLKPSMVWPRSRKSVWWKCRLCGYEWKAVIDSRVKGQKCPACAGRAVKTGYNDLATLYPELAAEWDISANHGLLPGEVRAASMQAAFWKDTYGHRFRAKISDRIKGIGCPVCRARKEQDIRIHSLAYYCSAAGVAMRLGSDAEIGIALETYLPRQKIAVEFGGTAKDKGRRRRYENAKNWLCLKAGIRLFRIMPPMSVEFDNCICITLSDGSLEALNEAVQAVFDFAGIDTDVDIRRDMREISGQMRE